MNPARLARRAAGKPPRYVAWRLADEARREALRLSVARGARGRGRLASGRLVPGGAGAAAASARENVVALGAWADAVAACRADASWRGRVERRAADAHARRIDLFGRLVDVPRPTDWQRDPVSGLSWPLADARRLDYADLDRPSDVRYAWEVARLRHAVALAQGAAVTGDGRLLSDCANEVHGFLRASPMGRGVHWACAMEVALRAVNLICLDGVLLGAGIELPGREELVAGLYAHGWYLARHLEVSSLNGNHYLADAVGLLWLARYLGGVGESEAWRARGVRMARAAAERHVLPDGLDHEGSLRYHLLNAELHLLAQHAAHEELASARAAVAHMVEAADALAGPDGVMPDLGDDDGGRALALSNVPARRVERVLALAAVMLDVPPARPLPADAAEDARWLRPLPDAAPTARTSTPRLFAAAGRALLGTWPDHVVVDVGEVGFRGLGGHGHVDAMSLVATLGGQAAVVDSGTGSYTGDAALRNRLRDVHAHSTVVLDAEPYARVVHELGLWRVLGDAPPVVERLETAGGGHVLVAAQRLPARGGTALLRRTVAWEPGELRIDDRVEAPPGTVARAVLQVPSEPRGVGVARFRCGAVRYEVALPRGAVLRIEPCERSPAYGQVEPGWRAAVEWTVTDAGEGVAWNVRIDR